jgi:hypothetical protein
MQLQPAHTDVPLLCQEVSAAHTTALGGFRPAVPMPQPEGRRRFASNRVAAVPGGSALGGGDSDADAAVDEQQLRALFREAREYQENAALRAQAARLHAQLAQFRCAAALQAPPRSC